MVLAVEQPVWHCPICRKNCCCSQSDCKQDHRHCKAYRYRLRRAELATKRVLVAIGTGEKRRKKSAAKGAKAPTGKGRQSYTMCDKTEDKEMSVHVQRPARAEVDHRDDAYILESILPDLSMSMLSALGVGQTHDPLAPSDVWFDKHQRAGQYLYAEEHDTEHTESVTDDGLGGFSSSREGFKLLPAEIGVLSEEEGCAGASCVDMDEARWIQRTYETVYNPEARQKALQALAVDLNLASRKGFSLLPPGRYPLDDREIRFLSGAPLHRPHSAREAPVPAKAQDATTGWSSSNGLNLSNFMQAQPDTKFHHAEHNEEWLHHHDGENNAMPMCRCTVMYDFQLGGEAQRHG